MLSLHIVRLNVYIIDITHRAAHSLVVLQSGSVCSVRFAKIGQVNQTVFVIQMQIKIKVS